MDEIAVRIKCALALCGFLCALGAPAYAAEKPKAPDAGKPAPVGAAKVVMRASAMKIDLPGTVLPWAETSLAAEVDARVEKLLFVEGQHVKKGAALVQLRTTPFDLERALALAEKQAVATRLAELRAGSRKETIHAAKAAMDKAQARLKLTRIELERVERLFKEGVLSVQDRDNAQTAMDEAAAQHEEKKAQWEEAVAGPRIEKIQLEEANFRAAQERVRIIEDKIERSVITAPFAGYIVKKQTEVGQWLEKGNPAVKMIAVEPLKVEVSVPQFYFNKIRIGAPAAVFYEGRRAGEDAESFKGEIVEKIHAGDPNSRTFPVRVKVDNAETKISAGMLVRVEIFPEDKKAGQLFVPKDALVRSPKDTVVWVARPGQDQVYKVHKLAVTAGEQVDGMVAVHSAKDEIKEGDLVVVQGNERLKPEAVVDIVRKEE